MFGLNFGFNGGDVEFIPTNCWTPLEQTGDILSGTLVPDTTADGTTIYNYEVDVSVGTFTIQFGALGDEQLYQDEAETIPVLLIVYAHEEYGQIALNWDSTNEYYQGTDQEIATALVDDVGSNSCFINTAIPDELAKYTNETMEVEA